MVPEKAPVTCKLNFHGNSEKLILCFKEEETLYEKVDRVEIISKIHGEHRKTSNRKEAY